MIPAGGECTLDVTKTCEVSVQPGDLLCESAIVATTLRYTGPDVENATVTITGKKNGSVVYNVPLLTAGMELTDPSQNSWTIGGSGDEANRFSIGANMSIVITNDADYEYEEIIHTSCSAVYEAGLPAPLDGKSPNPANVEKGEPVAHLAGG